MSNVIILTTTQVRSTLTNHPELVSELRGLNTAQEYDEFVLKLYRTTAGSSSTAMNAWSYEAIAEVLRVDYSVDLRAKTASANSDTLGDYKFFASVGDSASPIDKARYIGDNTVTITLIAVAAIFVIVNYVVPIIRKKRVFTIPSALKALIAACATSLVTFMCVRFGLSCVVAAILATVVTTILYKKFFNN